MHQGLQDEIRRIIFITLFALLSGLLTGYLSYSLLLAGFLYTCWLLHQTRKFYLWLENRMEEIPPDTGGIWGDIFDGMYRMHRSNLKTREEMQQQLDRVQEFTRALHTGIVLLNAQGNIQWWNNSAEKMLGFKLEFDIGKPVLNLLRDPAFITYFQEGEYQHLITLASPINANMILEMQITEYGKNEKLLAVQDITRLKHLEQMRKDFVANVSHELRTPLTVINGYLEGLVEELPTLDPALHIPLNKINTQAKRMTDIVQDLGTLSKLDNSNITDQQDTVAVYSLLEKIREDALALHTNKHIRITIEGVSFKIRGSATELQSCFSNLIYNAAKYSNPDNIVISVRLWINAEGGHVAVQDNGIGIDPIHIPRLTERFYRVDSSHSRTTGGTGLGLAIVKHALIRHEGHLEIQSMPGKGSTFTCHFSNERLISDHGR